MRIASGMTPLCLVVLLWILMVAPGLFVYGQESVDTASWQTALDKSGISGLQALLKKLAGGGLTKDSWAQSQRGTSATMTLRIRADQLLALRQFLNDIGVSDFVQAEALPTTSSEGSEPSSSASVDPSATDAREARRLDGASRLIATPLVSLAVMLANLWLSDPGLNGQQHATSFFHDRVPMSPWRLASPALTATVFATILDLFRRNIRSTYESRVSAGGRALLRFLTEDMVRPLVVGFSMWLCAVIPIPYAINNPVSWPKILVSVIAAAFSMTWLYREFQRAVERGYLTGLDAEKRTAFWLPWLAALQAAALVGPQSSLGTALSLSVAQILVALVAVLPRRFASQRLDRERERLTLALTPGSPPPQRGWWSCLKALVGLRPDGTPRRR